MPYRFGRRSLAVLDTIHLDLASFLSHAIDESSIDFCLVSGRRTPAEQAEKLRLGHTTTLASKHVCDPDERAWAVDVAPWEPGGIPWDDVHKFYLLAGYLKRFADERGIAGRLRWGADWQRFHDPGHIELTAERPR